MQTRPLIINFTPTGMIPTKEITPHVPISPSEIIEQVHEAYEIGITLAHLHARDENGAPTHEAEVYRNIVEGVRKHCSDLVICLSLSGRNVKDFERRSAPLDIGVDMGSLTLSSLNFSSQASVNSPEMIKALCTKMLKTGTKPELEVFGLGMINYANYLQRKNLIKPPFYFNIILGNIAGLQVDASQVGAAIHSLPGDSHWSLGGIGEAQLDANLLGIALGGGVRVGLEDNVYFDVHKTELATNNGLIERVHRIANECQRPIMTPKEFGDLGFYNSNRR